jgi:cysteine desulfurase
MSRDSLYFDHAAATPVDGRVLAAMQPYFSELFYNPSAGYSAAISTRKSLDAARAKVASVLGARSSEITFTAGGSEANNLAIHGLMRQFPDGNIVVSSIEHDSVLKAAERYDCRIVQVMSDGRINLDDLRNKIDDNTVLVSVMYANNEIGTVQPLRHIAQLVKEINGKRSTVNGQRLWFHTDACQAANYLDLHVSRLGVDMMTLNGGKIYCPKQSGALYIKAGLVLQPLIDGGGQEHGLRSGTENVAGAVGFATALELAQNMADNEVKRLQALQRQAYAQLETILPNVIINGSKKHRLPNNLHITIPASDNERVLIKLDEAGIQAAAGSACSASNDEPSHVLRAIGVSDTDAQASLRITMGRTTTETDVKTLIDALQKAST